MIERKVPLHRRVSEIIQRPPGQLRVNVPQIPATIYHGCKGTDLLNKLRKRRRNSMNSSEKSGSEEHHHPQRLKFEHDDRRILSLKRLARFRKRGLGSPSKPKKIKKIKSMPGSDENSDEGPQPTLSDSDGPNEQDGILLASRSTTISPAGLTPADVGTSNSTSATVSLQASRRASAPN